MRRQAACACPAARAVGLRGRDGNERFLAQNRGKAVARAVALPARRGRGLRERAGARRNADDVARQFPERRLRSVPALAAARAQRRAARSHRRHRRRVDPADGAVAVAARSDGAARRRAGQRQSRGDRLRRVVFGSRTRAGRSVLAGAGCRRGRARGRRDRQRRRRGSRPIARRSIGHPERTRHPDQARRRRTRQERLHLHRPGPHARSAPSQWRARAAASYGRGRGGNRLRQLAGGRRPGGAPRAAADPASTARFNRASPSSACGSRRGPRPIWSSRPTPAARRWGRGPASRRSRSATSSWRPNPPATSAPISP